MKRVKIGLKDKNRVDICEGDIIVSTGKYKYEVIYCLEMFGRCSFILYSEKLDECIPLHTGMEKFLEVVGSAYDE